MEGRPGRVTSAGGTLMCSLCSSQWEDHHPYVEDEFSTLEGCIQAMGRRIAEIDVRTAHLDGPS